jgi:hypothetical protein
MPRFYFHLTAAGKLLKDEQGLDLPDFSAAHHEALLGAREIVAEAIKCGSQELPDAFLIADEAGRALETLLLAEVLPTSLRK